MSIAGSSEQWSFENLTQSTDSGHPLLNTIDTKHTQNPPLSLVLGSEKRSAQNNSLLHRSPSGSSTQASLFNRKQNYQNNQRPDSFSSETFSIHTYQQQQQHAIYSQRQQHSVAMFATPESMPQQQVFANGAFRSQSPQSNSHTGLTPRSSVYSDRAVYAATSRNQDTSGSSGLNLYTKSDDARSSTPPLAAPAAVAHARMSDEGQSQHHNSTPRHVYRSYNSDHQLASSREQMSLQRGTAETALSEGHRSHSIVALSTSTAAAATQRTMPGSSSGPSSSQQHWNPHETSYPNRNSSLRKPNGSGIANYNYDVDPLAQKSYALPANSDLAPQNALEYSQWQRIRVERDYSTGVSRRFTVKVPEQLVGKLDEHKFKKFVRRINNLLASAEDATLRNVLEGCLAYATLYLSTLVIKPHFKKTIDRISKLVQRENEELFRPAGYLVIDPKQTAYMFIEIVPLE